MTINEIISALKSFGADNSNEEAYLIIEYAEGISRAKILSDRNKSYTSPRILEILEKRKKRIPLQYILGKWEFMGKEFFVCPDCLIPRPDTEILVERALKELKSGQSVADLCTGSGCIGLSLLLYKSDISLTLMDISRGALNMAIKNAKSHGIYDRCEFILGDILKDIPNKKFDMIVSNPPYIPTRDIELLSEEVKNEPRLALDGGENGLDIIEFLIGDGLSYLNKGGKMLIEFGYDQGEIIDTRLSKIQNYGKIKSYEILRDYGGNTRAVIIYAN
ncbi:MAG: peptide chain release factor N(5)-glutamine methyltransferase [Clostridia bacterium]|nr:peptide chain release factor N(5)-glutamine methyltransferase [Clostridia bacterium]